MKQEKQSKIKGVYWFPRTKKWHARVYIAGKKYHVGYFFIENDCVEAIKNKRKEVIANNRAERKHKKELKQKEEEKEREEAKKRQDDYMASLSDRDRAKQQIKNILTGENNSEKRTLFSFCIEKNNDKQIIRKFNIWSKLYFSMYFTSADALFHNEIDLFNLQCYRGEFTLINSAFRGASKRQPLNANILTPKGFIKLKDIKEGDFVIGSNGKRTKIMSLSKIVNRPIYRVTTEDGRSTECDSQHLWTIRKMTNVKYKHLTVDTQHMIDTGLYYNKVDKRYPGKKYKEYKYALEAVKPINFTTKKFTIEPYLLGLILGNGSVARDYGSTRLTCHKDDLDHYLLNIKDYKTGKIQIKDKARTFCLLGIAKDIMFLKLNVHSRDKFIPNEYLLGSISQRKDLLNGLMDTNGTVSRGNPVYCTISERLANGIVDLVRSLGGRARKSFRKNKYNGFYIISMLFSNYKPFRLERKFNKCKYSQRTWSRIVNIELVGDKQGRCLTISNKDGLYVTDDYILTHNSARTKLFIAFCIINDINHYRKYIKILSADIKNSNGFCTDIYNMLLNPQILKLYPNLLSKSDLKRADSMSNFATTTGVKVTAGTVGQQQRGSLFEASRPDLIVFDDFENDLTLRSAVKTDFIKNNIEEARTGLAVGGSQIYLCNYISESGNVHRLIELYKNKSKAKVLKISILDDEGNPTWDRYPIEVIEEMRKVDLNFAGERMNNPAHSINIYFNRDAVDKQVPSEPIAKSKGLKIYKEYNPAHNYAGGHDIAGGLGFDSSTSVFIDFSCYPAEVVASYNDNTIKPDVFAYEIKRQADMFGGCLVAPEQNNHGHATIAILKQLDCKIYRRESKASKIMGVKPSEYGWNTNVLTKTQMLTSLVRAIEDGLIIVNDPDIISELRGYTRDNAIEKVTDVRLVTRHWDLLIALCIAWQMKDQRFTRGKNNIGKVFRPKITRRI